MTKLSMRLGTNLVRLGQYICQFGAAGIILALEHQVKYRLTSQHRPLATVIPEYGRIYLRPRTSDLATFREVFVNRDYDLEARGVLGYVRACHDTIWDAGRKPLILDAGANVGLATLFFKKYFPDADVIAVEPGKENLAVAQTNVRNLSSVFLRRAAIWNKDSLVTLKDAADQSARTVSAVSEVSGESVESVTMDSLLGERKRDLFLVKLDIEGAEQLIFDGDPFLDGWLSSFPVVVIEGHDGSHNRYGSLSGLFRHRNYREGFIVTAGPALIVVPENLLLSAEHS